MRAARRCRGRRAAASGWRGAPGRRGGRAERGHEGGRDRPGPPEHRQAAGEGEPADADADPAGQHRAAVLPEPVVAARDPAVGGGAGGAGPRGGGRGPGRDRGSPGLRGERQVHRHLGDRGPADGRDAGQALRVGLLALRPHPAGHGLRDDVRDRGSGHPGAAGLGRGLRTVRPRGPCFAVTVPVPGPVRGLGGGLEAEPAVRVSGLGIALVAGLVVRVRGLGLGLGLEADHAVRGRAAVRRGLGIGIGPGAGGRPRLGVPLHGAVRHRPGLGTGGPPDLAVRGQGLTATAEDPQAQRGHARVRGLVRAGPRRGRYAEQRIGFVAVRAPAGLGAVDGPGQCGHRLGLGPDPGGRDLAPGGIGRRAPVRQGDLAGRGQQPDRSPRHPPPPAEPPLTAGIRRPGDALRRVRERVRGRSGLRRGRGRGWGGMGYRSPVPRRAGAVGVAAAAEGMRKVPVVEVVCVGYIVASVMRTAGARFPGPGNRRPRRRASPGRAGRPRRCGGGPRSSGTRGRTCSSCRSPSSPAVGRGRR